ncbi:Sensor histidine kinase RcsC [Candidatus Magnetaquicoccaceae bacterium FCR-1]|uniref:diguanylate cyclase n=1 Tax=Candidatus Magnetaquiglobus chichijimensis TaxID=3141448 RepID=A0ABQ0C6S3_9PROT
MGCGTVEQNENRPKVLIIDDETVSIDVLSGLLRPFYRVVSAKSGESALARLDTQTLPDLILLDVIMPGLDGYQVCERLKLNPRTRDIPVIFITSNASEEDETRGFEVGAVDYITKPYRPGIALARVRTHVELKRRGDLLERLAVLDGLTSIPNRRRFDQFLEYEWNRSQRHAHPFSLLLLDIDYFKMYNDLYGHAQGDACLRRVAEAIATSMPRAMDLAARYGGEEFACVLPETHENGAQAVAQRILGSVRALKIPHAHSKAGEHVTVSIGVACMIPNTEKHPLDLITRADQALYKAKRAGRNQMSTLGQVSETEEA